LLYLLNGACLAEKQHKPIAPVHILSFASIHPAYLFLLHVLPSDTKEEVIICFPSDTKEEVIICFPSDTKEEVIICFPNINSNTE
jgi:hypothetical protein